MSYALFLACALSFECRHHCLRAAGTTSDSWVVAFSVVKHALENSVTAAADDGHEANSRFSHGIVTIGRTRALVIVEPDRNTVPSRWRRDRATNGTLSAQSVLLDLWQAANVTEERARQR